MEVNMEKKYIIGTCIAICLIIAVMIIMRVTSNHAPSNLVRQYDDESVELQDITTEVSGDAITGSTIVSE